MAQQQHRQACLAHWPGHHSLNTETRRRSRNSQECSPRSKAEGHGSEWRRSHGCGVVAARPPSRSRDGKGAASCSWLSGRAQHGGNVRVVGCHPTNTAMKSHASTQDLGRKLQRGQPEQIEPQGRDPLSRARRRWRRLEARTTNPHSEEEACGEVEHMCHRAAAELVGIGRGTHRWFGIARGD
jgi:hypothetical protein